jgi:hypothetical protein
LSESPKDLDAKIGKALAEWPSPDKSLEEWEKSAKLIEARLREGARAANLSTGLYGDDQIFLGPALPQTPEERHNSGPLAAAVEKQIASARGAAGVEVKMGQEQTTRRRFKDLELMANTPPPASSRVSQPSVPEHPSGVMRAPEAQKGDSGIVDLALAAAADPGAAERAQQTPLASEGLFDEEPVSARPPPAVSQPISQPVSQRVAVAAPASVPAASSPLAPPLLVPPALAALAPAKKSRMGLVVGLIMVPAVAAAGLFFVMQLKGRSPLAVFRPVAPAVIPAKPAPLPETPIAAASATSGALATNDVDVAPPTATEAPAGTPRALAHPNRPQLHTGPAAAKAPPPEAQKPAAPETDPSLIAKNLPPSPVPEASSTLSEAMKQAAGPVGTMRTADGPGEPQFAPGSVAQRPSQGQVTGALGAVLPGARSCLPPGGAISRATVTFGSSGAVQSVVISGSASGRPEEVCIKAALSKARVPPFAQASYPTSVTIRP